MDLLTEITLLSLLSEEKRYRKNEGRTRAYNKDIESIDPYLDDLYSLQTPNSYHITQGKYQEKYLFL